MKGSAASGCLHLAPFFYLSVPIRDIRLVPGVCVVSLTPNFVPWGPFGFMASARARYPPLFVRTPSWSVSRSERQTSERITTAVVFSMADYQEPVRLWCWVAESRVTCVSHLGPWLLGVWHAWFRYMCVPGLAVAVLHPGRSCYNIPSLARCLLPPNFVSRQRLPRRIYPCHQVT